jgi:hypothetical protein
MYNKDSIGSLTSTTSYLLSIPSRLTTSYRFLNTITNSRSNISAHYDISNTMFKGSCISYPVFFVTDRPRSILSYTRIPV